jgi:hypothetical protein
MNAFEIATHKEALIARAEREREGIAAAWGDMRHVISPPRDPAREAKVLPFTSGLVRTLLPILGFTRFGKVLRMLSIGLATYRAVRNWR